jgi:GNAT superfamily N-acetyltransferase
MPWLNHLVDAGRVLVAIDGEDIYGHLQITDTGRSQEAVLEPLQGRGVGPALMSAAFELARSEGCRTLLVATTAADIGNLRFDRRLGFRMRSTGRDAFIAATGSEPGLLIDGIELRDRVWLDRPVEA